MSKKNNKATRRRIREFDLQREREDQARKAEKAAKSERSLAVKGVEKPVKKNKTFRIRKGVRVQGIVVRDAESKRKARQKLQAAGVPLGMDIDGQPAVGVKKRHLVKTAGGVSLKAIKRKRINAVVVHKASKSTKKELTSHDHTHEEPKAEVDVADSMMDEA